VRVKGREEVKFPRLGLFWFGPDFLLVYIYILEMSRGSGLEGSGNRAPPP